MPLLIDVGAVPEACCNHHFEEMAKAMAEEPAGEESALWEPHQNPYLRAHVEDFTRRMQGALQALQDAFAQLLTGKPIGELMKALDPWLRWDAAAFEAAKVRLTSKPAAEFTLDDWMLAVDYLIQRYLPEGLIETEAQYLTVRAAILGKIQANMAGRPAPTEEEITRMAMALPVTVRGATVWLNPVERATLEIANVRAALNIGSLTAKARNGMKQMIIAHAESLILGARDADPALLRSRLFDTFGALNRDFRRIAITESGECCNQGFIAATAPGQKVRRVEAYRGACPFCKSLNGDVFTVVSPRKLDKDGETEIWVGKTNIGRSASGRRREGGKLVERQSNEMWWPAAGVQHPNCRGRWLPVDDGVVPPGVDPAFVAKLDEILSRGRPVLPTE